MSKQRVKATVYDKKGRILAVGYNSYTKTHPEQARLARLVGKERKAYLHAEVAAIIRARGTPYRIHVERYGCDDKACLARPCEICQLAIKEAGIKEVSYTV
jgi:deoxycytidylate deaminase